MLIVQFQKTIYDYFEKSGRKLPWRYEKDPYRVLISEVMLQQTQVSRVIPKYKEFLNKFPTIQHLAQSRLSDVLRTWQGMGYNRRAKYLHETARLIVNQFNGTVPDTTDALVALPGIGSHTAGAIMSYAFNKPVPFIETNIRAVYLYFFFKSSQKVSDTEMLDIIKKTMDTRRPRDWFYALTDYGVFLKSSEKFKNIQSKHYAKQSPFEGSRRQVRGLLLRLASETGSVSLQTIQELSQRSQKDIVDIITDMENEGLVERSGGGWRLKNE